MQPKKKGPGQEAEPSEPAQTKGQSTSSVNLASLDGNLKIIDII